MMLETDSREAIDLIKGRGAIPYAEVYAFEDPGLLKEGLGC